MREMIKWKPFNTLLKNNDIDLILKEKEKMNKPIISKDRINEIDYVLKEAISYNKTIEVKYWNAGSLKYVTGVINKINTNEKYILINNRRMYFKNIINIKIIN